MLDPRLTPGFLRVRNRLAPALGTARTVVAGFRKEADARNRGGRRTVPAQTGADVGERETGLIAWRTSSS